MEELGSGVRKMYKCCPLYFKDALPVIEEGDVFKLAIQYNKANEGINGGVDEGIKGKDTLLEIITETGGLTMKELASRLRKSKRSTERYIHELKMEGLIEFRDIPKTGGYYLVIKSSES